MSKEDLKELVWIEHRLSSTLDELLAVRGLLNLMSDEFQKISTSVDGNSPDNRVELLFDCYRKLSDSSIQQLRKISSDLERQIKKLEGMTTEPPR